MECLLNKYFIGIRAVLIKKQPYKILKMKLYFIILLCVLSFYRCSNDETESIMLDFDKSITRINYSEISDSIEYINLENCDQSFLSKINQFHKHDSLLFFMDKKQKSITIFNDKGKFKIRINDVGKGPGEFLSITSFSIDRLNKNVCILDDFQQKILRYSYDGSFVGEISYDKSTFISSLACINNRYLCFYPRYLPVGRDGIWEIDSSGSFVTEVKDVDDKYKYPGAPSPYYTSYKGDEVSFYDSNTEELYSYERDGLTKLFQFDFKQKMPKEYHTKAPIVMTDLGPVYGKKDYYQISRIAENDFCFFLIFKSRLRENMYVYFNKKSKKMLISDSLYNDIDNDGENSQVLSYDENRLAIVKWNDTNNPQLQLIFTKKL